MTLYLHKCIVWIDLMDASLSIQSSESMSFLSVLFGEWTDGRRDGGNGTPGWRWQGSQDVSSWDSTCVHPGVLVPRSNVCFPTA